MSTTRNLLLKTLGELHAGSLNRVSVSELSRISKISRSSIYKYYPDIVVKINGKNERFAYSDVEKNNLKIELLTKRIKEQKVLVEILTRICSEQLIELVETKARYLEEIESKDIKLAYLESSLAKSKKTILKTVK